MILLKIKPHPSTASLRLMGEIFRISSAVIIRKKPSVFYKFCGYDFKNSDKKRASLFVKLVLLYYFQNCATITLLPSVGSALSTQLPIAVSSRVYFAVEIMLVGFLPRKISVGAVTEASPL